MQLVDVYCHSVVILGLITYAAALIRYIIWGE